MHPLFKLESTFNANLPFAGTQVTPTPLRGSFLLAHSLSCAKLMSLPTQYWLHPEFKPVMAGELLPEGGAYYAQVYAGHQFGHFVPQLGDGRAMSIGEITNDEGQRLEIQLKGAGLTLIPEWEMVERYCVRVSESFWRVKQWRH